MRFACRTCEVVLTRPVERLEDARRLTTDAEEPYVPRGRFAIADGRFWVDEHVDDLVVHPGDLVETGVAGERGEGRGDHYGCCGLDGGAGPTRSAGTATSARRRFPSANTPTARSSTVTA